MFARKSLLDCTFHHNIYVKLDILASSSPRLSHREDPIKRSRTKTFSEHQPRNLSLLETTCTYKRNDGELEGGIEVVGSSRGRQ